MDRRKSVLVATTIALLASLAAACAQTRTTVPSGPPTTSPTAPAVESYDRLVLQPGQRVSASGRVVAVPGRPTRFCAPVAVATPGYAPGHEPAPTYCAQGIDVHGVDLSGLTKRREKNGAVEGFATLVLTYHGHGSASAVRQAPDRSDPPSPDLPDRVPCPAPTGDWPTGPKDENLDLTAVTTFQDAHPGAVLWPAMLRPSTRQVVAYVLTLNDPAPVAAALRPAYGKSLCVVRSHFTQVQIDHAADAFTGSMQHGPVYTVSSGGLGPDAQPAVSVDLTLVTADIAAVADRQPTGLVRLQPWLAPSR